MNLGKYFTAVEIKDIIISVFAITLIFSYPRLAEFLIVLVAVIIAFLFYELAHKFVAQKFGAMAYYKMWPHLLLLGLITMFTPFKFVAPGAVIIQTYRFGRWGYRIRRLSHIELGLISVAGIAVNIFFALTFKLIEIPAFQSIALLNAWLALSNLLPFGPLDGKKILMWNWSIWFVLTLISFLLVASALWLR